MVLPTVWAPWTAAYTADARAAVEGKRLADYDYFRAGTEYNAADCRSIVTRACLAPRESMIHHSR